MNQIVHDEIDYQQRRFYRRLKKHGNLVVEFWSGAKKFLDSIPGIAWEKQGNKILIKEKVSPMKTFRDIILESQVGSEGDFKKRFPKVADHFKEVKDKKHLAKLRKEAIKKIDANEEGWKDGPVDFFVKKWRKEFTADTGTRRSAADSRSDMILRTKDSSGKSKARKW
jgi:hypothetical protein